MGRNEGVHGRLCSEVHDLSESKGRKEASWWIVASLGDSRVEVGRYLHGFVDGLPRSQRGNESIWVVVDRLMKSAHFIPLPVTKNVRLLCEKYIQEVVRLHGVPLSIVSDRDTLFTSRFWKGLQSAMGMNLAMSTEYHPQTDGQTERINQTMEDMLRVCVLDSGKNWEDHLPYVEFYYNNSFQASIGMAPF